MVREASLGLGIKEIQDDYIQDMFFPISKTESEIYDSDRTHEGRIKRNRTEQKYKHKQTFK